jgi:hypothetical protein
VQERPVLVVVRVLDVHRRRLLQRLLFHLSQNGRDSVKRKTIFMTLGRRVVPRNYFPPL